jgi:hypothetical protein
LSTQDAERAKPFKSLLLAIVIALLASLVVMVLAAARDARFIFALAPILFAAQIVFAMLRINGPLMRGDGAQNGDGMLVTSVLQNSVLTGLVYGWGAAAMLAVYHLSGLHWRHGWQYGAAMALVAIGIFIYARRLNAGDSELRTPRALAAVTGLGTLQGLGLIAALAFLVLSGKLATPKADWAANVIFVAGSVTLALLSLISVLTYRKLTKGHGER